MGFRQKLLTAWFRPKLAPVLWPLLPLAWLFRLLVAVRRQVFRWGLRRVERLPVPVVVVGNLIVGGAGKTPTVLWLVERLQAAGRRPGILSRGYGGAGGVCEVTVDSDPRRVGDEPVLLAARAQVPIFIGKRRAEAGRALLAQHPQVDVLICDDGLQHYALARDVEIVVSDQRGLGNRRMLPAGPLREPASRLSLADVNVQNSGSSAALVPCAVRASTALRSFSMVLLPGAFYALQDARRVLSVEDFIARFAGQRLYAIAGIGHPQRFFDMLSRLGLSCDLRAFSDHHAYVAADLAYAKNGVLLMTEKDAIKCRQFYTGEAWVLPVTAGIDDDLAEFVLEKINGCQAA